uniref:hypothetical protein n=1 Tax=Yoonia sp. TaxID=2212373 RepID=UPI00404825F1
MTTFQASVQYDDFKGEVACDRSDTLSLKDYLLSRNLAKDGEYVIGFRIHSNGVTGDPVTSVSMVIYLSDQPYDEGLKAVRAVDVQMSPGEALSYFKRFDLVATNGLDTTGVEVDGPHY